MRKRTISQIPNKVCSRQDLPCITVFICHGERSPRSGRARTSRTIPTTHPMQCRVREYYRGTFRRPLFRAFGLSCWNTTPKYMSLDDQKRRIMDKCDMAHALTALNLSITPRVLAIFQGTRALLDDGKDRFFTRFTARLRSLRFAARISS